MRLAAMLPALGVANSAMGLATADADREGISRNCECIHQEVLIKAPRKRVYEALTEEKQFKQVTDFIMKGAATTMSPEVGGRSPCLEVSF